MHPHIKSKLPHNKTTIFTVISSLAAQHGAVNLGQGFPDFGMDEALPKLVNEAMQQGHNQYVHMNGLPALREALAEKVFNLYGNAINAEEEITITPGGTYALFTALSCLLNPGDEVIVFEPAYDCYIPTIELNGATAVSIALTYPDYKIDWTAVKEKINNSTKAILINSPHNPTGKVLEVADMLALESCVARTGIFIISDEVYEHLIFDGKKHESVLKYPNLYERSFVCFSFGKVYNCTGWKMGYCIAAPVLMKEFRKIHQFNAFTCFGPVQYALAEFLKNKEPYLNLSASLQQKRDFFAEAMQQTKFKALPSYGSYFQLYSYDDISEEKEYDFAVRLVKEVGVAAIPVSSFYKTPTENKVLRFCFTKKEETLLKAVDKLKAL